MSLTRVELEQEVEMCSGADEYRERDRTGQLILAHDAALREERDAFRNAICDVGTALGLIMPERVSHFAVEGVSAVTRLRQRVAELEIMLKGKSPVYQNKHAYEWHDEAMAHLTAWHTEVDTLKAQLAAETREREAYKAVLVGAEYQDVEGVGSLSVEHATKVGELAAAMTKGIQARLREVEGKFKALAEAVNEERMWATGSDHWIAASAHMYDLAQAALHGSPPSVVDAEHAFNMAECSRCNADLSEFWKVSTADLTVGYYEVRKGHWSRFANEGERYLCEACLRKDPRYIAVYGENKNRMTPHTWTRERPTQPGYYWWRRPNHPAALGRVFGPSPGLRFELFPDDEGDIAVSNTWEDTEWYGPLEVPG